MDDPGGMRRRERLGDAQPERDGLGDVERAAREAAIEVLALEPLHREELLALRRLAVREVPDDPGVAELREHLGLRRETVALALEPRRDLERDRRAAAAIARPPDHAHPALAGDGLDLEVLADDGAGLHRRTIAARRACVDLPAGAAASPW